MLDKKSIESINELLKKGKQLEVHVEKDNIVVVEINRKLISKTPINS